MAWKPTLFLQNFPFSNLERLQRCALPSSKKKYSYTEVFFVVVQASVTQKASVPNYLPPNVSSVLSYTLFCYSTIRVPHPPRSRTTTKLKGLSLIDQEECGLFDGFASFLVSIPLLFRCGLSFFFFFFNKSLLLTTFTMFVRHKMHQVKR